MPLALPTVHHHRRYSSHSCSTAPALTTLFRPHENPPRKIPLPPSPNSHKTLSLRETCRQGSLRDAFVSLSSSSNQNPFLPSQEAYSSILELCASQKALCPGRQIHAHILTSNSISDDGFLSTKLLFMYGKCGSLSSARQLFDEMPHRTIFAWNALVGAYASNGRPYEAIELYRTMRVSGILPDSCTFASVLKACAGINDLYCGTEAHGLAVKCGFVSTVFVLNALVSMYAKCGQFDAATRLFEWLPEKRDVVSWNSIISAYLQHGQCFEVLGLFREMQKAGIEMNSYTVVGVLQACAELFLLKLGMEIHASLFKCCQSFKIFEANALVVMYARCGRIGDAVRVFREMSEKDSVSWNSMLSGYVQNELYDEAVNFFFEMQDAGCKLDQVSIISIASALGRLGILSSGMEIHANAIKHGFDFDLQVGNTLMDMYTKCSRVEYAEWVFHKMPDKDFISWTTIIAGYAHNCRYLEAFDLFREVQIQGMKVDAMMIGSVLQACSGLKCLSHLKEIHSFVIRHELLDLVLQNTILDVYGECGEDGYALGMFQKMENKDIVSWTSMINCYVQNGLLNKGLDLFYDMEEANVEPDAVALISILAAIADLSALRKGKEIHGFLIRKGFAIEGSLSNSLVDMYARSGDLDNCYKVFERLRHKDLVLWTTLINANGMHGRGKEAIDLFGSMQKTGLVPDLVTFLALLYSCSHSGLADEGKIYFDIMKNGYGLEPWPEHYACVVDLLGRSGRMDEAYDFITSMPIEPTAAVWCALLGACRVRSNSKMGRVAAQRLLELESDNSGNYVLISNVLAAAGKWNDVEDVRVRMKAMGLRKSPARSWIEVGNKVHSFIARDSSHPESAVIYSKLAEITERLGREFGYAGDTSFVLHDVKEEEKVKFLYGHSERLAIAFGLIGVPSGMPIRITKNLRVCGDCHEFTKLVSKLFERQIVVRDSNRFHHFEGGSCSCGDFW